MVAGRVVVVVPSRDVGEVSRAVGEIVKVLGLDGQKIQAKSPRIIKTKIMVMKISSQLREGLGFIFIHYSSIASLTF